jgi:hypothetical protein
MNFSLHDVSKSSQKLRSKHTQYLGQFLIDHVINIGSIALKQADTRTVTIPPPSSVSSHVFSLEVPAEMEICTGMTISRQAEMRVVTHNPGLQCCITLRAPMRHEAVVVVVLQVKEHT